MPASIPAASRRDTWVRNSSRPSGCSPSGTRIPNRRSSSRSDTVSFGISSGSPPGTRPRTRGCCGRGSCVPPGPSRWPVRWDGDRWRSRAGSSRNSPRPQRRRRCRRTAVPPGRRSARPRCPRSRPELSVSRRSTRALRISVTLGCAIAGRTAMTSASDLAWTRHGKPSQVAQRMQARECSIRLVEQDPAGCMRWVQSNLRQVVVKLLDAGFVRHRREGIGGAARAGPSDPRLGFRAPGTAARPGSSTAPDPGSRWARRARCRRSAEVHRSRAPEADRGRHRTASWPRRRCSAPGVGSSCRPCRTRCRARRSGCRRIRPWRPSSRPPGAASPRVRGSGCACPMAQGGERESRHRRRNR